MMPLPLDIALRIFRKCLPVWVLKSLRTTIGRAEIFRGIDHPYRIVRTYFQNVPIVGKDILEIGPGHSVATAVLLLSLGAKRVFLMERMKGNPFLRGTPEHQAESLEIVLRQIRDWNPDKLPFRPITVSEAMARIVWFDCFVDDNAEVAKVLPEDFSVDTIVSTLVLEHVQSIQDSFATMHRLLRLGGKMYHLVDLSDHLYHFAIKDRPLNSAWDKNGLSHLRYPASTWKLLDTHSLHMNRVLLPEYLRITEQMGLKAEKVTRTPVSRDFPIHTDLLSRIDPSFRTKEWLQVRACELLLEKEL